MAYREFRNELLYAAPEFDGLPMTVRAIQDLNHRKMAAKAAKAAQEKEARDRIEKLALDKPEEFDMAAITEKVITPFVQKKIESYRPDSKIGLEELQQQEQAKANEWIAKTKADAAKLKNAQELVKGMPDYVNKGQQELILQRRYAGEGVNYENRNVDNLVQEVDPRNNPELFNQMAFVEKALSTMKAQKSGTKTSTESGGHDGASTTTTNTSLSSVAGIIWDEKTKSYKIDPHRKAAVIGEIFNHDGEVGGQTWRTILEKEVEGELGAEVARYVAAQKAKGLEVDPVVVRNQFMLDAASNPYSGGKTIAQRVMDKAEAKILTQAQIDHQYDYTKTYDQVSTAANKDASATKKKDLEITPSFHVGQARGANSSNQGYGGPGVTVRYKAKPLILRTTAPVTYTVDGGKIENQKTERTIQTDKFLLLPVTKGQNLGLFKATTPDEMVAVFGRMTDEQILRYQPELQGYFRAQVSDKFNTLNDVEGDGESDLTTAVMRGITNKGVTSKISNEFVPATDDLYGQMQTMGLTREQLVTPDMQRVQAAWTERYNKALNKNKPAEKPAAKTETKTASETTGSRWDKYKKK